MPRWWLTRHGCTSAPAPVLPPEPAPIGTPALTAIPWQSWDAGDGNWSIGLPIDVKCQDGFVKFVPGLYSDLVHLNLLMKDPDCKDTLFWFAPRPLGPSQVDGPGVFVFDFIDVNAPGGDLPWTSPDDAQVVGGTPKGWTPDSTTQTKKGLTPGSNIPSNGWGTDLSNPPNNTHTDAGEGGNPSLGLKMDNIPTTVTLDETIRDTESVKTVQGDLNPPMPDPATGITNLHYRFRYQLKEGNLANGSPNVQLRTTGSQATCDINLSNLAISTPDPLDTSIRVVDITTACPGTALNNNWPANDGPGGHIPWTAALVNTLTADFSVTRLNISPFPYATVNLDGMDFEVDYTGRPVAPFPGGCKVDNATDYGVQFIFANLSRIDWQNRDATLELCGSIGVKDPRAIAVYGLAPDRVPLARSLGTDQQTPWTTPLPAMRTKIDMLTSGISTESSDDSEQRWEKINSDTTPFPYTAQANTNAASTSGAVAGKYLYSGTPAPWTGNSTQTFAIDTDTSGVPGGQNFIPDGSVIEHVYIRLGHAEPTVIEDISNPVGAVGDGRITFKPYDSHSDSEPDDSSLVSNLPVPAYRPAVHGTAAGVWDPTTYGASAPGNLPGAFKVWTSRDLVPELNSVGRDQRPPGQARLPGHGRQQVPAHRRHRGEGRLPAPR